LGIAVSERSTHHQFHRSVTTPSSVARDGIACEAQQSMASIKVAIRCRPFSIDDKLGVKLRQLDEENGEVELINCDYSTTRFPFTYSWWSAYGYQVLFFPLCPFSSLSLSVI
jgi:hypothetical protein